MELFFPERNKHYGVLYDLLMEINKKTDKRMKRTEIIQFIQNRGIYQPFFEKAVLNKNSAEKDNLYLLYEVEEGIFSSNYKDPFILPLIDLELFYLKEILDDRRINLFLEKATINKLKEVLRLYKNLNLEKNIEIRGIRTKENYPASFLDSIYKIVQAKNAKRLLKYTYITKNKQVFKEQYMLPYKIEYSIRDDKFYIIYYSIEQNKIQKGILDNFSSLDIAEVYQDYDYKNKMIPGLIERQKLEKPASVEIKNIGNALERAFFLFSCFEKEAFYKKEKKVFLLNIYYYDYDESEVIARILSLGKYATLISPKTLRLEIIARIRKVLSLYEG